MIDSTNRNTALATALVEELVRCGARHAVLSPGSRSSPVALALERESDLELTVVLDERCAGFVALGAALESGLPALVACTSGSAAANLHPAVVEADQAGVPLIVLSSDRPPELRGIGAGQTIDQIALYGSAVRWFCEVGTHDADDRGVLHMRSTACRAFGESVGARGPVHLNLSWRDPLGPEPRRGDVTAREALALEGRTGARPLTLAIDARAPDADLVAKLSAAVQRAERGLIVAGREPDRRAGAAVVALASACGFPLLAEPTSGVRYGPHAGEVVSAYDAIARERPGALRPDFVLRLGDMPTSKALRGWLEACAPETVVIDPPGAWNEPTRRADALVRSDGAALADALCERIGAPRAAGAASGWRERWQACERAAQDATDAVLAQEPRLSEPAIHRVLGEGFAAGDRVLLASSMPVRDAEAFMRAREVEVGFFSNRGANGIDGSVSTGCGIALASAAPTWVILGDLALQHDLGGLASVAAVGSPLRIVVIDNAGGGIFDFLPQADQVAPATFERLFTTPSAIDLEHAGALFGLPYVDVTDIGGLRDLSSHDRVLARVRVDREGNVALHRRLAAATAEAISEALG